MRCCDVERSIWKLSSPRNTAVAMKLPLPEKLPRHQAKRDNDETES